MPGKKIKMRNVPDNVRFPSLYHNTTHVNGSNYWHAKHESKKAIVCFDLIDDKISLDELPRVDMRSTYMRW